MTCRRCGRDYEGNRRTCPFCRELTFLYTALECPKCGERMMFVSVAVDDRQARDVPVHVSSGSLVCLKSKVAHYPTVS